MASIQIPLFHTGSRGVTSFPSSASSQYAWGSQFSSVPELRIQPRFMMTTRCPFQSRAIRREGTGIQVEVEQEAGQAVQRVVEESIADVVSTDGSESFHFKEQAGLTPGGSSQEVIDEAGRVFVPTYATSPVVFVKGEGCKLLDAEGREYLDMSAGIAVNALGHGDPAWVKAVTEQLAALVHASNVCYSVPQIDRLCAKSGFSKDEKHWNVPWTWLTIIKVIFLWFCAFWLMGSWIIPLAAHYLGCSRDTLTYRGQALYSLITDIAEGTVGLGILHLCLAQFHPLSRDWFPMRWQGQWYIDVLLGCLMFPIVNQLSKINLDLVPLPSQMASSYEQSIMKQDPVASVLHIAVVSICCPIWEEVIFRGFLLPSLTRYLPVWASILVSAVVFGLAHFNMQRMLPLTFLGLMMGIMFVRSRNLLSSMFLHSLWNGFVFIGLQ